MLNIFIFFIVVIMIIFYYKIKNRVDVFLIFVVLLIVYFYPILFFDNIYLYTTSVAVSIKAKIILFLTIIFILFSGLLYKTTKIIDIDNNLNNNLFIGIIVFFSVSIFIITYSKIGLAFLSHHDKGYMTLQLGKLEPIYHIMGILLITTIIRYRVKKFYLLLLLFVIYDILLGFRMLTFVLIIQLLLYYENTKLLKFILFGFFAFIIIIVIKETDYFSRDLDALILLWNKFTKNPFVYIMIFNSESSSISAVFNEIVKNEFLINPIYYFESLLKLFPFLDLKSFSYYYKGVLFGKEGDSFASGMFSVSYSLFGIFSYIIFILIISYILYFYETKFKKIKKIEIQVFGYSVLSIVIFYHIFRSDLMAIVIYLRSFFIFIFIFHIIKILLLQFKKIK